jgi:hypothetical protein
MRGMFSVSPPPGNVREAFDYTGVQQTIKGFQVTQVRLE